MWYLHHKLFLFLQSMDCFRYVPENEIGGEILGWTTSNNKKNLLTASKSSFLLWLLLNFYNQNNSEEELWVTSLWGSWCDLFQNPKLYKPKLYKYEDPPIYPNTPPYFNVHIFLFLIIWFRKFLLSFILIPKSIWINITNNSLPSMRNLLQRTITRKSSMI